MNELKGYLNEVGGKHCITISRKNGRFKGHLNEVG